jgi:hypothetical protein
MGRFGKFIVEYVGNLDPSHRDDPAPRPASADRRTNRHARELVDWLKGQLDARGFPADRKHEFVHDLRQALRQGGPTSTGVSAIDASGEGTPGWVPDTKGVSRDAPS